MSDRNIAAAVMDHFDDSIYNIRYVYFVYYFSLNVFIKGFVVLAFIPSVDDAKYGGCQAPMNNIRPWNQLRHMSMPSKNASPIGVLRRSERHCLWRRTSEFQGQSRGHIYVCINTQSIERPVISDYLRTIEPDAVQARHYQRFKRRTFLSIGPNEMWSLDQHDKFKRYGLFFHVGLDPFPGVIHWCKVWWTVRNPKLIARFYLDAARDIGGTY